jgi:hypothetical protein
MMRQFGVAEFAVFFMLGALIGTVAVAVWLAVRYAGRQR